jgi:hypothetical protein
MANSAVLTSPRCGSASGLLRAPSKRINTRAGAEDEVCAILLRRQSTATAFTGEHSERRKPSAPALLRVATPYAVPRLY